MLQRDPAIRRFIIVIRVILPIVVGFTVLLYALATIHHATPIYVGAGSAFIFGITLSLAHQSLMGNNAARAANWVAAGALSGTLFLTEAVPDLYASTVLVPLLVAILLLQYTLPQHRRQALIICGLTSAVLVLLGQFNSSPILNEGIIRLLNASLILTNSAVAILLLWQLTSHLHEAITAAQAANTALVNLNNRLQRELHEHQRTLSALHASEQQGQALLHAIPDALFRLHHNGTMLDFKPFDHSKTTGAPAQEAELSALLPEAEIIEQAVATKQIQHYERQLWHASAARTYEGRVVAVDEHEVVAIVRDVTEARAVDRLKAEFVSTVSHELRTPLTAVRGAISLIVGGVAGEVAPQVYSMLEIAARNCERLLRLVNDILDIDQLESGKLPMQLAVVPLAPLLEQTVITNAAYGTAFRVALELVQPLPQVAVRVDSARLTQAITNLISNAVKFSPPDTAVLVGAQLNGATARITVTDRGPGIDESFRGIIFQRFAQADSSNSRAAQGSGLGLSITKAIVEQCNGRVDFHAEPGGGTTFFIDLPVAGG